MDQRPRSILRRGVAIPANPLAQRQPQARRAPPARAAAATTSPPAPAGWRSACTRRSSRSAIPRSACSSRCSPSPPEEMDRADAGRRGEPLVRDRRRLRRDQPGRRRGASSPATSATTPACSASPRCRMPTTTQLIAHCRAVARGHAARRLLPPAGRRRAGRCRTPSGGGSPRSRTSSRSRSRRSTATRRSTSSAPSPRRAATTSPSTPATTTTSCSTCSRPTGSTSSGSQVERRIVGGLLGHWSVWTQTGRGAARRVPGRRRQRRRPGRPARAAASRSPTPTPPSSTPPTASPAASPGCTRSSAARGCSKGIWCLDPHETPRPRPGRGDRPRLPRLPAPERRRVRRRSTATPGSRLAGFLQVALRGG